MSISENQNEYRVVWRTSVWAESPGEAASTARAIQEDPFSMATVFEVIDENDRHYTVDVAESPGMAPAEEEKEAEDE